MQSLGGNWDRRGTKPRPKDTSACSSSVREQSKHTTLAFGVKERFRFITEFRRLLQSLRRFAALLPDVCRRLEGTRKIGDTSGGLDSRWILTRGNRQIPLMRVDISLVSELLVKHSWLTRSSDVD